jgi:sugar-phosphatase
MDGTLLERLSAASFAFGAVLFDLDGTLVDSEDRTERAVARYLSERGADPAGVGPADLHGVTWGAIATTLARRWPYLGDPEGIAADLSDTFHSTSVDSPPPQIPGAADALSAAAAVVPVAIVTSGDRATVDVVIDQLGIRELLAAVVTAEDITRSKPDPEPYLLGARRVGVEPARCLVFEDSRAGIASARAAGARVVRVGASGGSDGDADVPAVADYRALPHDLFARLAGGRGGER